MLFFFKVLQGLYYLHSNNIIHGRLTTDLVYACDDGSVKIGSYGLATSDEKAKGKLGDVYMLGCILYSLLTFHESPLRSSLYIPSSASLSEVEFNFGSIGKHYSKEMKQLLKSMINPVRSLLFIIVVSIYFFFFFFFSFTKG
jgi:serine/threonine protein kinase